MRAHSQSVMESHRKYLALNLSQVLYLKMKMVHTGELQNTSNSSTQKKVNVSSSTLRKCQLLLSRRSTKQISAHVYWKTIKHVRMKTNLVYFCKQCAQVKDGSPNMCYCPGCFNKEEHVDHDLRGFTLSSFNWAYCDCGRRKSIVPEKFCPFHGSTEDIPI